MKVSVTYRSKVLIKEHGEFGLLGIIAIVHTAGYRCAMWRFLGRSAEDTDAVLRMAREH